MTTDWQLMRGDIIGQDDWLRTIETAKYRVSDGKLGLFAMRFHAGTWRFLEGHAKYRTVAALMAFVEKYHATLATEDPERQHQILLGIIQGAVQVPA